MKMHAYIYIYFTFWATANSFSNNKHYKGKIKPPLDLPYPYSILLFYRTYIFPSIGYMHLVEVKKTLCHSSHNCMWLNDS